MNPSRTLTRRLLATTIIAFLSASPAWADQFDYTLRTGLKHSDNINLSETDPIGQSVLVPGIDFAYGQEGSTFQANITGSLEYRDYLGNAFDNQTLGVLSADTNWTMIPQRLDFVLQDAAAVEPLSTLSVNTPNNQQQTNVLTLGPTLHFRMGQTLRGQTDFRYINSRASKAKDFNSSRGLAALRIIKDINAVSQFSINAQEQHVRFDTNSSQEDYDRTDLYVRYQNNLKYFKIDLSGGQSQLRFRNSGSESNPLVRASVSWLVTPHNELSLTGKRAYSDASEDLSSNVVNTNNLLTSPNLTGLQVSTGQAEINSNPYLLKDVSAIYAFTGETLSFSLSPSYERLDYTGGDQTLDQIGHGATAGFEYKLNPHLSLTGYGNSENRKYTTLYRHDKFENYGLALIGRSTSHWRWRLSYDHLHRHSTAPNQSYTDNEIYLGFAYAR